MSSDVVGSMVVVEGKGDTEKPVDREKVSERFNLLQLKVVWVFIKCKF